MKAEQMTRKDFLSLRERCWAHATLYYQLIIVPTGIKRNGWELMAIVGCNDKQEPVEIAAYCEDFHWVRLAKDNGSSAELNCDMYPKSKCIRFWSKNYDFEVGISSSSTDLRMIRKVIKKPNEYVKQSGHEKDNV